MGFLLRAVHHVYVYHFYLPSLCGFLTVYVCQSVCLSVDRYTVNFVPRESGRHYVHVKLNGVHVPGSPYPVQVGQLDADVSQVRAYGDGLYKGFTGNRLILLLLF